MQDIEKIAKEVKQTSEKVGIDYVDILVSSGESSTFSLRDKQLDNFTTESELQLSIRAINGKKEFGTSFADFSSSKILHILQRVKEALDVSQDNEVLSYVAKDSVNIEDTAELELYDNAEVETEQFIDNFKASEQCLKASLPEAVMVESEFSFNKKQSFFLSSSGLEAFGKSSMFSKSIAAILEKDGEKEIEYDYTLARHVNRLRSNNELMEKIIYLGKNKMGAKDFVSKELPVILDRRIVGQVIMQPFLSAINGAVLTKQKSFLSAKLGEDIFAKNINIIEDPLAKGGLKSAGYDREGARLQQRYLVQDGVLNYFILDTANGNILKQKPFNAFFSGAAMVPKAFNTYLQEGNISLENMLGDLEECVYITGVMGMGSNLNSGDYSQGISALYFKNGKIQYPIKNATIAFNFLDIYKEMVCLNDASLIHHINYPSVYLPKIVVGGKK